MREIINRGNNGETVAKILEEGNVAIHVNQECEFKDFLKL